MDVLTMIGRGERLQIEMQRMAMTDAVRDKLYMLPIEVCLIHQAQRIWNCAEIDSLGGFGELDESRMSDGEIARLLQKLSCYDFIEDCLRKDEFTHLKVFVIA